MFKSTDTAILNPSDVNAVVQTSLDSCLAILLACECGWPVQSHNIVEKGKAQSGVKVKRSTNHTTAVDACSFTIESDLYKCTTTFSFAPIMFNDDDSGGTLKAVSIQLFKQGKRYPISESTVTIHQQSSYSNQVVLAYETIREFFDRNGFPQDLAYKNPAFKNFLDMEFVSPFAN